MPHPDPEAAGVRMTPDDVARHVRQPMYPGGPVAPERKETRMPTERSFAASAKWGAVGIIAFALVVVAFKWGPPAMAVDAPDRWTGTDQIRFEAQNNERIAKLERILERVDVLLTAQAQTTNRLLALVERQDDRIKALEEWQRSPHTPGGNK